MVQEGIDDFNAGLVHAWEEVSSDAHARLNALIESEQEHEHEHEQDAA